MLGKEIKVLSTSSAVKELRHGKKYFDSWSHNLVWPNDTRAFPLIHAVKVTVEDIKFAYNAWSLVRLCLFYGVGHPHILSDLSKTTPSVLTSFSDSQYSIDSYVKRKSALTPTRLKIGLTPSHPKAVSLYSISWNSLFSRSEKSISANSCRNSLKESAQNSIELVLGMENGLSSAVADQCDILTFIPQEGSIGSLSMLSALAIALHHSANSWYSSNQIIGNNSSQEQSSPVSKEKSISAYLPSRNPCMFNDVSFSTQVSTSCLKKMLLDRRLLYKMQLSILVYNDLADRNIGGIIRNANVFNCEKVIVINRRKFNKRGTLGTHHITDVRYFSSTFDENFLQEIHGYEIWLVYQYYPYLHMYSPFKLECLQNDSSWVPPQDEDFIRWSSSNHRIDSQHPLIIHFPHLKSSAVFLDNEESISTAVKETFAKGYKGIMLAVPEEGTTPHPCFLPLAKRVVFVSHPSKMPANFQRGLNGALSTAVALECLRKQVSNLS